MGSDTKGVVAEVVEVVVVVVAVVMGGAAIVDVVVLVLVGVRHDSVHRSVGWQPVQDLRHLPVVVLSSHDGGASFRR